MTRRTISLVAVLSLFLFGCAGLSELTGAATPTIPPDLPPLELATEMPVATDEVAEETPAPEESTDEPTEEASEEASEEPTEDEELPDEPVEAPLLESILAEEASRIVMLKELDTPGVNFIAISPMSDTMAMAVGNDITLVNMPWPAGAVELKGHTGKVNVVNWSSDGSQLASASDDGTVRLWDTETGEEASKFDVDSGGVSTVAWSPDDTLIAVGLKNGSLQIRDPLTGDVTLTIEVIKNAAVSAVTWSSDASYVATGTYKSGTDGEVQVWEVSTGEAQIEKPTQNYQSSSPTGLVWSPLEDLIAWVNHRNTDRAVLMEFGGDRNSLIYEGQNRVLSIAWNPDGDMIASGGLDHTVQVWGVAEGDGLAKLTGHRDAIHTVAWSADGTFIVSADSGGSVRIWGIPEPAEEE